jgi:hypothetical protein
VLAGKGNIDPHRADRQQFAVELSQEGCQRLGSSLAITGLRPRARSRNVFLAVARADFDPRAAGPPLQKAPKSSKKLQFPPKN